MLHIVDTVELDDGDAGAYVDAVHELGVPVMSDVGATLVSCDTTEPGIGEPVRVQIVWSVGDYERWNVMRRDLVLDPRWHAYGARLASLRTGGRRRFFTAPPTATATGPRAAD